MTIAPALPRSELDASLDAFLAALPLDKFRDTRERRESLVILRALRLGPTLEVGEAILRGERVPVSRLDPYWARAYGLR